MQIGRSQHLRGEWKRWSRYNIVNGVLVGDAGAELQDYDPWQAFRLNEGKYRTVSQPYVGLLELHRSLKGLEERNIRPAFTPTHSRHLDPAIIGPRTQADDLILEWCNENGLLGLVPVLANSIRPAPIAVQENPLLTNVEICHQFRSGGIWYTAKRHPRVSSPNAASHLEEVSRCIEQAPKPGVAWFNWISHDHDVKELTHIEDFYRPVWSDEPLNPPSPGSPEFWNTYGEPLRAFVDWCEIFAMAVEKVSSWTGTWNDEEALFTVRRSHWALSGLSMSVAPASQFDFEENAIFEERISAGLLGSFALMFLWDREAGRRVLRCETCDAHFVSDERQAKYCSLACRRTAASRRYRSRKTS